MQNEFKKLLELVTKKTTNQNAKQHYYLVVNKTTDLFSNREVKRLNASQLKNYDVIDNVCTQAPDEYFTRKLYAVAVKGQASTLLERCAECGKTELTATFGWKFNDEVLYVEPNTTTIGRWRVEREDGTSEIRHLCEHCKNTLYTRCDHCGMLVKHYKLVYNGAIGGATKVKICERCYNEQTYVCADCGKRYIYGGRQKQGGGMICGHCFIVNNYAVCRDCGFAVPVANAHTNTTTGRIYCGICWEQHKSDRPDIINCYHTSHGASKNWGNADGTTDKKNGVAYIGLECEIDGAHYNQSAINCAYEINEKINTPKRVVNFEHDGSLSNGFECVYEPFAIDAIPVQAMDVINSEAERFGLSADETGDCGLHIHFGREILGNASDEQRHATLKRLVNVFMNNEGAFECLSKRDVNDYATSIYNNYDTADDFINDNDKIYGEANDRYYWLNLTNRNTIEIRLTAGTTDSERIQNLIKFYYYLISACRELGANEFYELRYNPARDKMEASHTINYRNIFAYINSKDSAVLDYVKNFAFSSVINSVKGGALCV